MVLRSLIHRAPYKSKLRLSNPKQRILISSTELQLRARKFGTTARNVEDGSRIRNIGIIAHIDAGKTTTTERMLYYSGHTRRIGDVDDGSTVTDFLPAERARGITIQSAAITFDWPPATAQSEVFTADVNSRSVIPHHINLIDTPGHADFTFEVRRSIRVLDGAVCILDGVAGVEAQTEQVWNQAGEWKIPRIIYINKLDRDGAAFGRAVREVGSRLGGSPAVCQIPWFAGGRGSFTGVADVVNLRAFKYDSGSDGKHIKEYSLPEIDAAEPQLGQEIRRARTALIELLSLADESMVETFLEAEADHLAVTPEDITTSIRWCLLEGEYPIIPVFAGASFRNIGVQPLLNAVNDLLPGPEERPDPDVSIGLVSGGLSQLLKGDLLSKSNSALAKTKKSSQFSPTAVAKLSGCALAFKVVNDPRKGMLVYIRVYSGTINKNDVLFNTNLQVSERAQNLLRMYASESVSIQSIEAGQIGVIAGSKSARTGDTLISYQGPRGMPPEPLNQIQLRPIHVPPPVFFAAIEPNSLKEEKDMHEKLALLLREDPSLHVNQDEDTGQTLLSGMGELHLEIARDRLVNDLKANARMGPITIGYRETLTGASDDISKLFDKDRSDAKGKAGCTASVRPLDEKNIEDSDEDDSSIRNMHDGNEILIVAPTLDRKGKALNSDNISLPSHLTLQEIQAAYLNGALAALSRGPTHSYPVRNAEVRITLLPEQHLFGTDTTTSSLASAARLATVAAFKDSVSKCPSALMEPVMNVDISVPDNALGKVVQDISSARGGHIVSLGEAEETAANSPASSNSNAESATDSAHDARRHFYAPPDPWESTDTHNQTTGAGEAVNRQRTVKAKVPLKEMVGYLKHLRSMTGGRGTFVMSVDRFERMTAVRERGVIMEMRGG